MRTCQRRFAFQHLIASGVAKDDFRRRAYVAKQSQELSAWQGHIVHDVLAHEFVAEVRQGRYPQLDDLTSAANKLLKQQLEFSRSRRYEEMGVSKAAAERSYCVLSVHRQGGDIDADAIDDMRVAIGNCLGFILGQADFIRLLLRSQELQAESSLRFFVAEWPVRATLDLVFKDPKGQLWIVDWKIAKSLTSDYSHQLRLYALAVLRSGRWGTLNLNQIKLVEANLLQMRLTQHPLNEANLAQAEDFAFRGIVELRELVGSESDHSVLLDDLDTANSPATCGHCAFAELCIEALVKAGRNREAEVIQGTLFY